MKKDVLQEFLSLQTALQREREELIARLRQIEEVLGRTPQVPAAAARPGRRGRGSNPISLRDAVLKVTSVRPLTKQEVYEAVQKLGYRFGGKDPLNSLGVVLYGKNPRFKNQDGRFSPALPGSQRQISPGRQAKPSAAARERMAAAQRARWAKAKSAAK
jgi:hypothetical protein